MIKRFAYFSLPLSLPLCFSLRPWIKYTIFFVFKTFDKNKTLDIYAVQNEAHYLCRVRAIEMCILLEMLYGVA